MVQTSSILHWSLVTLDSHSLVNPSMGNVCHVSSLYKLIRTFRDINVCTFVRQITTKKKDITPITIISCCIRILPLNISVLRVATYHWYVNSKAMNLDSSFETFSIFYVIIVIWSRKKKESVSLNGALNEHMPSEFSSLAFHHRKLKTLINCQQFIIAQYEEIVLPKRYKKKAHAKKRREKKQTLPDEFMTVK